MNCRKMSERAIALLLAAVILLGCMGSVTASAAESWSISEKTEIFLVKNDDSTASFEQLSGQVSRFAGAMAAKKLTQTLLPITYGEKALAGEKDILLVLDADGGIPAEGYQIAVSGGNVTVTASDEAGLQYGCNALLRQLLTAGYAVNAASAPDVAERALMLDIGRKYYEVDWIKEMIRELAWANMNTLVLHFSEEMGLGIESKLYPWLNGRDGTLCTQAEIATDNRYLTQEEIGEIVEYANQYHVQIVPSFDSPGHMNYIVKKFNEQCATNPYSFTYDGKTYTATAGSEIGNYYHYNNQTTIVKGSRNTAYSRGIDISNEVAVAFTRSLIEEYARLFHDLGCDKFDIGGDELLGWGSAIDTSVKQWLQLDHWKEYAQKRSGNTNAVAYDGFMYYMNDLYDLVTGLGYTSVRMWNDDALRASDTGWKQVVKLNTKVEILYWDSGKNTVSTYTGAGYKVYNYLQNYTYYILGKTRPTAELIYTDWNPYNYGSGGSLDAADAAVKGSAFCIWGDNPAAETEEYVMEQALPRIRANGAKAWDADANATVSYSTYSANQTKAGNAPADVSGAEIWVIPNMTALEVAIAEYEDLDAALYTAESYKALTDVVEAARELMAGKPSQAEVDAAEDTVYEKLFALEEIPTADTAALEAAIAQYAAVNGKLYTEESYGAYTAAVNAAKALLAGKPSQEEVDAAEAAVKGAFEALELIPPADTSALEAAIAEYEEMDPSQYTEDSFTMYTAAVQKAKALLQGNPSQEEVDAALALIQQQKDALREKETVGAVDCFIGGAFKSASVNYGKTATIQISVYKNVDIVGFEIYNDLNTVTKITKATCSTSKADRDNWSIKFSPTKAEKGERTYTIYAILADGTLSADSLTLKIKVK